MPEPYEVNRRGDIIGGKHKFVHPRETSGCTDPVAKCLRPLVMFVGGARDVNTRFLLEVYNIYDFINDQNGHQDVGYSSYHSSNARSLVGLAKEWHKNGEKVCFVGHSWGGDTVMNVVRELHGGGITIELVVTLDPVGTVGKGKYQNKRSKKWINVYVDYSTAPVTTNNIVAQAGGPWESCPNADTNIIYSGAEHGHANAMFGLVKSDVVAIT